MISRTIDFIVIHITSWDIIPLKLRWWLAIWRIQS